MTNVLPSKECCWLLKYNYIYWCKSSPSIILVEILKRFEILTINYRLYDRPLCSILFRIALENVVI